MGKFIQGMKVSTKFIADRNYSAAKKLHKNSTTIRNTASTAASYSSRMITGNRSVINMALSDDEINSNDMIGSMASSSIKGVNIANKGRHLLSSAAITGVRVGNKFSQVYSSGNLQLSQSTKNKLKARSSEHLRKAGISKKSFINMSHRIRQKTVGYMEDALTTVADPMTAQMIQSASYTSYVVENSVKASIAAARLSSNVVIKPTIKMVAHPILTYKKMKSWATKVGNSVVHPWKTTKVAARYALSGLAKIISFVIGAISAVISSIVTVICVAIILLMVIITAMIIVVFADLYKTIEVPLAQATASNVGLSEEVNALHSIVTFNMGNANVKMDRRWEPLVLAIIQTETAGIADNFDYMNACNNDYISNNEENVCQIVEGESDSDKRSRMLQLGLIELKNIIEDKGLEDNRNIYKIKEVLTEYHGNDDPKYCEKVLSYYRSGGNGIVKEVPDFSNEYAYIQGNPYQKDHGPDFTGQCTWFAWGFFYEIYGYDPGFRGNGRDCVDELLAAHPNEFTNNGVIKAGTVFSVYGGGRNHVGIITYYDGETIKWIAGNRYGNKKWNWEAPFSKEKFDEAKEYVYYGIREDEKNNKGKVVRDCLDLFTKSEAYSIGSYIKYAIPVKDMVGIEEESE